MWIGAGKLKLILLFCTMFVLDCCSLVGLFGVDVNDDRLSKLLLFNPTPRTFGVTNNEQLTTK